MKLSEQLQQDHECGDFGKALYGYSERAKAMEEIIQELTECHEATYSSSPEGRAYLKKCHDAIAS